MSHSQKKQAKTRHTLAPRSAQRPELSACAQSELPPMSASCSWEPSILEFESSGHLLIRTPASRERDAVLTEAQFRQYWISKIFKIMYSTENGKRTGNDDSGCIDIHGFGERAEES
jgi:hypothetical protein